MENLLTIQNLYTEYATDHGLVQAVNGVSLTIGRGETLGLVGETGAGKTTTALSILKLIQSPPGRIKSGKIFLGDQELTVCSDKEMQKIRGKRLSMIFQDPMTALNPVITVGNQIAEVIRLHEKCSRAEAEVRASEMLEMVGIPAERSRLSGVSGSFALPQTAATTIFRQRLGPGGVFSPDNSMTCVGVPQRSSFCRGIRTR